MFQDSDRRGSTMKVIPAVQRKAVFAAALMAVLWGVTDSFAAEDVFDVATGRSVRADSDAAARIIEGESLGVFSQNLGEKGEGEESTGERILKSIEWAVVAEGELVSNLNSNTYYRSESDAVFTADFGFLMKLNPRSSFYGLIETGYGLGLDGRIPTFAGFNVEVDGERHAHFSQAWYEQKFGDNDQWRFKVGQLDISCDMDTNAYANCGYYQFNSTGFVVNRTFEHDWYTLGAVLWRDFGEHFSLGGAYLTDGRWDNVFSAGSGIFEADFHISPNSHPGNYRFYGWVNQIEFYCRDNNTNCGWGISADQEISHYFGLWGRIGFGDGSVGTLESHLTGGIHFQHFSAKYDRDIVGVAYGIAAPGEAYASSVEFDPEKEHFIEAYYLRGMSEHAHLTPFIQYVKNPAGDEKAGSVFVLGLRGVIEI